MICSHCGGRSPLPVCASAPTCRGSLADSFALTVAFGVDTMTGVVGDHAMTGVMGEGAMTRVAGAADSALPGGVVLPAGE